MGMGHSYRCPHCGNGGFLLTGVGMRTHEESEAYRKAALNGEHGEEIQKIVKEHPEGRFDCEWAIYQCACGYWNIETKGDYTVPEGEKGRKERPFGPDRPLYMKRNISARSAEKPCGRAMRKRSRSLPAPNAGNGLR